MNGVGHFGVDPRGALLQANLEQIGRWRGVSRRRCGRFARVLAALGVRVVDVRVRLVGVDKLEQLGYLGLAGRGGDSGAS